MKVGIFKIMGVTRFDVVKAEAQVVADLGAEPSTSTKEYYEIC